MELALQHAVLGRRGAGGGRSRRLGRRAGLLLATAMLPAAALVVPTATPAAAAAPVIVPFGAGANQPFTVPAGVTELTITATGAVGQSGLYGGTGGIGADVTATLPVTSGTTLFVNVGTGRGPSRCRSRPGRCRRRCQRCQHLQLGSFRLHPDR
ncbi:hypothetical protein [Streptomyces sp. NPDC059916]|uniref:hypothetical protein n=1 Tax=Streptomyces sp. NPDC059916 TaxID=3347001 RepID=UPI0036B88A08